MNKKEFEKEIKLTYEKAIAEGQEIEINEYLPYIAIKHSADNEYFFQGEEAENIITEYNNHIETGTLETVSIEEWLLWWSQGW
jgi:hypothetical protein